jgi:soluble lytic murein transglycosylase
LRRLLLSVVVAGALIPTMLVQGSFPARAPGLPPEIPGLTLPLLGQFSPANTAAGQSIVDRATKLRREGSYEEAAAVYLESSSQPPADAALRLLGAAEAELAASNFSRAEELAELALNRDPGLADALLVQGQALIETGNLAQATIVLGAYPPQGKLAAYAAYRQADAFAAAGDGMAARAALERAVELGLNAMWRVVAARRIAKSYLADGEATSAASWLARAVAAAEEIERRRAPIWFDGELVERSREVRAAPILLELGEAHRDAGNPSTQIATYASLVTDYPSTSEAGTALDRLIFLEAEAAVSAVDRGRVLYQIDRNREALATLAAALAGPLSPDDTIRAEYYAALARRDAGEPITALADLRVLAASYPSSPFARQALVQAARIAETHASRAEAIAAHLEIAESYPATTEAGEALLRLANLQVRSGQGAAARATLAVAGQEHPDARIRTRALYPLGRRLLDLGDTEAGTTALREGARLTPLSFEGVRSSDLAHGGVGAEPFARLRTSRLAPTDGGDAARCVAWIRSWSSQVEVSVGMLSRLARISGLQAVGMSGPAQAEALDAAADAADRPLDLHALARMLASEGLYGPSIHAALRLAAASPERDGAVASVACVGRLVYPLAFAELVQAQADRYGFDPYLFLALLRQESWFSPRARSSADARGLSQVIPSTAAGIARDLRRVGFKTDDLYRPYECIAFGARYFSQQIDALGGRPLLALAAYNAGAGNALRWAGQDRRVDPDDFVEAISFTETRTYVRSIHEIYAHYRHLYP